MNKLTTLLASLVIATMSFASTANSIEYKFGVTGQTSAYYGNVEETLKGNKTTGSDRTTDAEAIAAFSYASGFAEIAFDEVYGVTFGVEYTPQSLDLKKETRLIQQSRGVGGTAAATAGVGQAIDSGTQVIDASVDDLMLMYVALPVMDSGLYVKVGYGTATLKTKESLATGSSYKDEDLEMISAGFGYDMDVGSMAFVRVEAMLNQFDDISLTGSESDEAQAGSFNKIKAELGGVAAKLSLGLQF
jgi:hypothetical protein